MEYYKVFVDGSTGEETRIPLTDEEVQSHTAAEQAASLHAYKIQREAEYPPITDYLDGLVKGDQTQINKYISDCLAVKAKYPKP